MSKEIELKKLEEVARQAKSKADAEELRVRDMRAALREAELAQAEAARAAKDAGSCLEYAILLNGAVKK